MSIQFLYIIFCLPLLPKSSSRTMLLLNYHSHLLAAFLFGDTPQIWAFASHLSLKVPTSLKDTVQAPQSEIHAWAYILISLYFFFFPYFIPLITFISWFLLPFLSETLFLFLTHISLYQFPLIFQRFSLDIISPRRLSLEHSFPNFSKWKHFWRAC